MTPCRFRDGQNGFWVGFSQGFSQFPLPQISFHHFSILISVISLHQPLWQWERRDRQASLLFTHFTFNIEASSHLIPRPGPVLDTSWGDLFYMDHSNCSLRFCTTFWITMYYFINNLIVKLTNNNTKREQW